MKKIAIVGGGINGFILAFYLTKKNYLIDIYESTNNYGGILKDVVFNEKVFLNSCQYLDYNSKLIREFLENIKVEISNFNPKQGSFTNFNNSRVYNFDYPGPTFQNIIDFSLRENQNDNLESRLRQYPNEISISLINWLKKHQIDLSKLHTSSCYGLGVSRIRIKDIENKVLKEKEKNKLYDDLYSVNRSIKKDLFKLNTAYPKKGYSNLFNLAVDYLINQKVRLFKNRPVIPIWKKNKLYLRSNKETLFYEHVVWTGNPTKLIYDFNGMKLDSVPIKKKTYFKKFDFKVKHNLIVNVFSDTTSITQIYIYNIHNYSAINVVVLDEFEDVNNIILQCENILKKFKFNLNFQKFDNAVFQKNYFLLSNLDSEIIQNFNLNIKNSNLVEGNWHIYQRGKKLEHILKIL